MAIAETRIALLRLHGSLVKPFEYISEHIVMIDNNDINNHESESIESIQQDPKPQLNKVSNLKYFLNIITHFLGADPFIAYGVSVHLA